MKTETRTLQVRLSPEERSERARTSTDLLARRDDVEARAKLAAKIAKGEVETLDEQMHAAARAAREGTERRQIECTWEPSLETLSVVLRRDDTFDVVDSRPMTAEERQLSLPVRHAAQDAADKATSKKGRRKADVADLVADESSDPAF